MSKPKLVERLVSDLVPYERNARTHTKDQISKLVKSIKQFGFTQPILIDENNLILAGHGRLEAAKEAGLDKVPCVVKEGLTQEQKQAYIIADNKIAEEAGWDKTILKLEFEDLKLADFDCDLTGFTPGEVDNLFKIPEPPKDFEEFDENIKTDHQCPSCHYQWSGKCK